MKIVVVIICLVLFIFIYWGCTKTAVKPSEHDNECIPKYPDQEVTYNGYVKNILNTYCISCHYGSGIAPGDFRTYKGVLPYTEAFQIRVIQDNADMPQGSAPLPKSIRDSLAIWIGNCAPEQ